MSSVDRAHGHAAAVEGEPALDATPSRGIAQLAPKLAIGNWSMRVVPVPVLSDNYSYLVIDSNGEAVAVDPAEPDKVLWAAKEQRARLQAVLTTHHHRDHAGGNKRLAQHLPQLEIVGGADGEPIPACTRSVRDGDRLEVGELVISCLATPYHTHGHVCFVVRENNGTGPAAVFTGDVLFVGGCGRMFAGTPEQMHSSLQTLAGLPPESLVYCGHEYSVANLEFAAAVDGSNPAVLRKLGWAKRQREQGLPTVPSTIQEELEYNPFLRCHEPAIQRYCGTLPPAVMGGKATPGETHLPEGGSHMVGTDGSDAQKGGAASGAAARQQDGYQEEAPGQAVSEELSSSAGAQVQRRKAASGRVKGVGERVAIDTLAELRRRKDNFGVSAKLVTTALTVGSWFGWAP